MNYDSIPRETLDTVVLIARMAAYVAVDTIRTRWYRATESLSPPDDIEVVSAEGHAYTGILVVESNRIRGGLVAKTIHDKGESPKPHRSHYAGSTSLSSRTWRDSDNDSGIAW